jgi:hypothetical protein
MPDIKRENYTTGQFLTAADFLRDQTYHLTLRHLHAQNLHTPGIATGLTVSKVDDTHIAVSAGMALDPQGRELVLLAPVTLDLSGLKPAGSYYLMIGYAEVLDPADKVQIGGADAYVATTERPSLTFVEAVVNTAGTLQPNGSPLVPAPAGSVLVAMVDMQGGKLADTGTDYCTYSGPALPPSVSIQYLTVGDNLQVKGQASFAGIGTNALSVSPPGPCNFYTPINLNARSLIFTAAGAANFDNSANGFGFASLQNAMDLAALVISGRTVREAFQPGGLLRAIQMYDTVEVHGPLKLVNSWNAALGPSTLTVPGDISLGGRLLGGAKGGYVMDRFVNRLGDTLEAGDVVVIAGGALGYYGPGDSIPVPPVDLAAGAYDTRVCGIVCEVHAETAGDDGAEPRAFSSTERAGMDTSRVAPGQVGHMVTLGAYAFCKVDADIAPVAAGDLLTTSPTRGHAQKVLDRGQAAGAIVGKALAGLDRGRGIVPVMVMLQ